MNTTDTALWRYSVIAPLLHREPGESLLDAARREAAKLKTNSNGEPATVSLPTILRWYRAWQLDGIGALERQPRNDRSRVRAMSEKLVAVLLDSAEAHPEWTVRAMVRATERETGERVPEKAAYRLLAGHRKKVNVEGFPKRPVGVPQTLWIGDTWHGPAVYGAQRKKHRTFLIAIMDDASRSIMAGRFGLRDDVAHLIAVVRDAVLARGIPQRLLVDNGANYRSRVIHTACATLGIHLIHATPYRPTAKARLERFFLTTKLKLVPLLSPFPTLEELNTQWARFLAEYHAEPHASLSELEGRPTAPLAYYLTHLPDGVRYIEDVALDELLVVEETRLVLSDGTFRVDSRLWEAGCEFAGERILVRFNPTIAQRSADRQPVKVMFHRLSDARAAFQPAHLIL